MNLENARSLVDANLLATVAVPAAGSTAYTSSIDLIQPSNVAEGFDVQVSLPAMAAHADSTKSVTLQIQHSADNSTFVAVPELAALTVPGVATTGSAAFADAVKLPRVVNRYIRLAVTDAASDANLTAFNAQIALLR